MGQPYVGEIRMFAGNFAPNGWEFCDGRAMSIALNEVLFQLIGTTYGGDGESTFNLPDLRSRLPLHRTAPNFDLGETGGVEAVTLTPSQMPVHNHGLVVSTGIGNDPNPGDNVLAESSTATMFAAANPSVALAAQTVGPAGGNQPHDNMQPFVALNFIISLYGIFPSPT
jgi:microcystin-dependent protein